MIDEFEGATSSRRSFLALGGMAVAALSIGGAAIALRPGRRDAVGCLKAKSGVHHAVVWDATDPLLPVDEDLGRLYVRSLAEGLAAEDRLTLLRFAGEAHIPAKHAFEQCRLPRGSELNGLFANQARADRHYEAWKNKLDGALTGVVASGKASETHLCAFIGNLVQALRYRADSERLIVTIISDFCEHTPDGSFLPGRRLRLTAGNFSAYLRERVGTRLSGITLDARVINTQTTPPALKVVVGAAWRKALADLAVTHAWGAL